MSDRARVWNGIPEAVKWSNPVCPHCGTEYADHAQVGEYYVYQCECGYSFEAQKTTTIAFISRSLVGKG